MSTTATISAALAPIHRAGWPFVALFFAGAVILGFVWKPLFWVGLLATAWCAYFFRDPQRTTDLDPAVVSSPADGVVQSVGARVPPKELGLEKRPYPCVSIFMNVFDVHVNRTPIPGKIVKRAYHPGKFLNASLDKASEENERQSFLVESERGRAKVGLVQIAGLVARRIIAFKDQGDAVLPGERVGLIRFGSRCDVYLPEGVAPRVLPGQRAVAGETVLARLDDNGAPAPRGRTD